MERTSQVIPYKCSLMTRILNPPKLFSQSGTKISACRQCGLTNHKMQDCRHLGLSKCDECRRFSHNAKNCWGCGGLKWRRITGSVATHYLVSLKDTRIWSEHRDLENGNILPLYRERKDRDSATTKDKVCKKQSATHTF